MADSTSGNHCLGWRGRPGWAEGTSTVLRREVCKVDLPGGPLDIRGGRHQNALVLNGKIGALHWSDGEGSIGQNLVRASSSDYASGVGAFRDSVSAPVREDRTLAFHFSAVLQVLAVGTYELILQEIPSDAYVVEMAGKLDSGLEATNFYPGFGALVATQSLSTLSVAYVDRLGIDIRNGARPIVITLCADGAPAEFIIDGHHKVAAYRQTRTPMIRLNIVRLGGPGVSLDDFPECLQLPGLI